MSVIRPKEEKIASLIDEILPQFRNLLKTPSPDL
jgi:hypothetical protein